MSVSYREAWKKEGKKAAEKSAKKPGKISGWISKKIAPDSFVEEGLADVLKILYGAGPDNEAKVLLEKTASGAKQRLR